MGETVAELARRHGLARMTAHYRIKNGIPLDAPIMSREERIEMANKKRLEMLAAGTLKKRKYRTDPKRLERPLELRVKAGNAINPFSVMAR